MKHKDLILLAVILFFIGSKGLHAQVVKDIDGNVYTTITIGTQVWMAENLKTTKFNNGTSIPYLTGESTWAALHGEINRPAYCWYNDDAKANKNSYGALYNWWTVKSSMLCPTGWHVPTDEEWTVLVSFLGGDSIAGGKLKTTGTTHWLSPNTGATNESGFNALPGGYHSFLGPYLYKGAVSYYWSSTEYDLHNSYFRLFYNDYSNVLRNFLYNTSGFSVRCIKD